MKGSNIIEVISVDLVAEGALTQDQLAVAKGAQETLGGDLGQILIKKGFITEKQLLKAMGKKLGLSVVSLTHYEVSSEIIDLLPPEHARKWQVIPLFKVENKVVIATADPFNLDALDDVSSIVNAEVDTVLAPLDEIDEAIKRYYKSEALITASQDASVEVLKEYDDGEAQKDLELLKKAKEEAAGEDVVKTLNAIFYQAFKVKASDLHIEPMRKQLRIRFRVDGILEEASALSKDIHLPLLSRIKIVSGLDVAESRLPQDGRIRVLIDKTPVDMRINTYPTLFGEAAAIRLSVNQGVVNINDSGLFKRDLDLFKDIIKHPHGIFLVTGPTGSGKTTTLYGAMGYINTPEKHLISIEDPIEREIIGVDQTQINVRAGMTFPIALRAVLRQDPDIIMVGEIRDGETAEIAIRAAMTGHLVFSSLHTNTALGAVTRLMDLGIPSFLISSSLLGVMAQRLVRKICESCKSESDIPEHLKGLFDQYEISKVYKGYGCQKCKMTGYKGRVGIFEIFAMNDELRIAINKNAQELRMIEILKVGKDYHTLMEDGVMKIAKGLTTIEEVLRTSQST